MLRRRGLILILLLAAAACQPRPAAPPEPVAGTSGLNQQLRDEAERVRDAQERDAIHRQIQELKP